MARRWTPQDFERERRAARYRRYALALVAWGLLLGVCVIGAIVLWLLISVTILVFGS